ncbi:MAG: glycerol-3-phosphate dehydrogenase/oxidase [Planctomycetales bacterium]|nr:glycerol-3-phosphate dehydrogenase/oxidase [Planctomycetales bacterium]
MEASVPRHSPPIKLANLREKQLGQALSSPDGWDVVIIGGGATGLGAAVDSAARGYRTLLLEAHDFAKGTSSRSTKLIHGGVRYLASGQLSMVRHALAERERLLKNAPHVVHTLEFVIPSPGTVDKLYYWTGLKLYDWLAGKSQVPPARSLSRAEVNQRQPTLRPDRYGGGILYCDAQFDDARLAISLARTAIELGACVLNYVSVDKLLFDDGKVVGLEATDQFTMQSFSIRSKATINATGVFAERILTQDPSFEIGKVAVRPSQGIHLVLPQEFLPTQSALLIPKTDDGRVLFAIPWLGKTLIGTTDVPVQSIQLEPRAQNSEIDYLLEHVGRYLMHTPKREDVLSVFAGLRPLVDHRQSSSTTASMSREHHILCNPSGLISIIGGKWTTYRHMAEEVVDLAQQNASLMQVASTTANLQLVGASRTPVQPNSAPSLTSIPQRLACFGTEAASILELEAEDRQLAAVIHPESEHTYGELHWMLEHEMAVTIEDVLARRWRLLLLDARLAIKCAPPVARFMAACGQHDENWVAQQVKEFESLARGYLPENQN